MITLDLNHFGFQRAGRPERRRREERVKGREEVGPNPGPTSMVVSWTVSMHRAPTRVVIEGGGAPSQGQPKWWRAGQGAVPPRCQERSKDYDMDVKEEDKRECSAPGPS